MIILIRNLLLVVFLLINGLQAQSNLECLTTSPLVINCSDYNLCNQCKQGSIQCQDSKTTVFKCQVCNGYSVIQNGETYCSSADGCSSLDKTSGFCLGCKTGYYATFLDKGGNNIEINCSQSKINLKDTLAAVNALTGKKFESLFETKVEIIYKYAMQVLQQTRLVEEVRPIWMYSRYVEECGGQSKVNAIYESCQCKQQFYGSRCQLLITDISTVNAEIKNSIAPALQDLSQAFQKVTIFDDSYPIRIINILKLIAEVAEGFDIDTYKAFDSSQALCIASLSFDKAHQDYYNLLYWNKETIYSNDQEITNRSVLYSFYSIYADRLGNTINSDMKAEFINDSSTLTKPNAILEKQLNQFYTDIIANILTQTQPLQIKATQIELYYQTVSNINISASSLSYNQAAYNNVASYNFMSLESLTGMTCLNDFMQYPRFFISKNAQSQISDIIKVTGAVQNQNYIFINQFSYNPYAYKDPQINSPIIQTQFLYGLSTNTDYSKLQGYQVTLQQEFLAVLIPKFKSQQYMTGVTTSLTCKVLIEGTNEWSDSTDLGVQNDKTIECNTHVICFYDLQANLAKNRKFGYQINFKTIGPNDEFFDTVNGDYWRTSGFIIPFILLGLFLLFVLIFLFVPALNSQNAPKRKIQLQELERQGTNNRQQNYRNVENVQTDYLDTEGRQVQTERIPHNGLNYSQNNNVEENSNAQIIETTEMDALMSLHFYSIIHTTERSYKIQKISILIMNWHFIGCFLAIMYKFLTWNNSNIVVGIVYTIIVSWFANYIWGFIAVKFRRTVEGSPNVHIFYYILYVMLFCFLFFIELQASEYFYQISNKQKWHGIGFLLCILIDYVLFDVILVFFYQYLSTKQQSCFHGLGSFLRHRGFYQH